MPRIFNKKQALEQEVKDLWLKFSTADSAASGTLATTDVITITAVTAGVGANGTTIDVTVAAAAANPTDTVLADVTGTSSAIAIEITPNDGTNNSATAVSLTTAELRELIATGAVAGKNVTLTDSGNLLDLITASGGGAADVAEADGLQATLAGGVTSAVTLITDNNGGNLGIASVARTGVGEFLITLQDSYVQLKYARFMILSSSGIDLRFQLKAESNKAFTLMALAGATPTELPTATTVLGKLELRNSSAPY